MDQRGRLLELIGDTGELLEIRAFLERLNEAISRAMPCDWVSISDTGPTPDSDVELVEPPIPDELLRVFAELAHENPLRARAERTGDGRAWRMSDVVTTAEYHALEIYTRFYREVNVEYQMACTLPSETGRILAIVLSRGDRDFTDGERDLLNEARPFLIQSYRNAVQYAASLARSPQRAGSGGPDLAAIKDLGLTPRQAEVLRLVATGASQRDIAEQLGLSLRTVQKHVERCYRRLGVSTRSEASARAWSAADGSRAAGG